MDRIRTARELQPYVLKDIVQTGRHLGKGSFGHVVEVIHAGALCAAKVIHEGLIDSRDAGHREMINKIEFECRIMSSLRHPNIVQFLGICFFEESKVPVLVMECLDANLETLLTQTTNLSTPAKIKVLLDVAKGLVYLHTLSPPIIHRDLTARNVLLTNTLLAKIGDLGNSRIIESNTLTNTLSSYPGTLVYMPPEAMATPPVYNEKLDIFSFGHLALYTILQDFPCKLLQGVYNDPKNPDNLYARNEVERRFQYVGNLRTRFGPHHAFTKLVTECLHNHPQTRPSAVEVLQQLQKLQREHGNEGQRFTLSDCIHMPEEKVNYGSQPKVQNLLERIKGGGIDSLEKEVKKMGRKVWKQFAFQMTNSTLKYFSRIDRRPEDEVPLDGITDIQRLDNDPNEPYQFMVTIEGKRQWKLKASSEEERYCWMTVLNPNRFAVKHQRNVIQDDSFEEGDLAYAYVQMAPRGNPRYPNLPRQYQQLGDRNQPQPYASVEDMLYRDEQQAQERVQSMYDIPKTQGFAPQQAINPQLPETYDVPPNRGFAPQPAINLQIPETYAVPPNRGFAQQPPSNLQLPEKNDIPRVQQRSRPASPFEEQVEEPKKHQNLQPHGQEEKRCYSGINLENMDPEQLQLLVSQLEAMGVLDLPKDPVPTAEIEELYPELDVDDTYDTISDEEQPIYDDIAEPAPKPPYYVNVDEVQTSAATNEVTRKVGPPPPPRIRKRKKDEAIPRTKSVGRLFRDTAIFSEQNLMVEDAGIDNDTEEYIQRPSWMKANTLSRTVRADDPLLSMGEQTLYISPGSISHRERIGEGQFGLVFKATLRTDSGRKVAVAIKTIRQYDSKKETDNFMREMAVMSKLMHPNIIRLHGVVRERNWIVLQYLPNGDLKHFLIKNHRPIQSLMKYMNDIAMGMLYLSEKGLIHRDLAARNIMVGDNEQCKVADFGLLREPDDYKGVYTSSTIIMCPLRWMAPESIEHKQFSTASDVWSYGILLWEMFNPKEIPYPDLTDMQFAVKVARGYTQPIPSQCPSTVAKIMKSCWHSIPSKRPSFAYISVLLTRSNLRGPV